MADRALEIVPTVEWGVFLGEGLMNRSAGKTYGAAALLFGAADFEIGKTRYAGVFLEFCIEVLR